MDPDPLRALVLDLIHQTDDPDLLDLVYRILASSANQQKTPD